VNQHKIISLPKIKTVNEPKKEVKEVKNVDAVKNETKPQDPISAAETKTKSDLQAQIDEIKRHTQELKLKTE